MADKKNPIAKGLVWIVLLLLIVGLAGFGATSFGGSTRTIGSVGDTEITMNEYARALQQEIRGLEQRTGQQLSISQAREFGLDQIVLQRLVATAALEDEAEDIGLSVGDAEVAQSIRDISAFQGFDGGFDAEAYRFALQQAGLTVSEFESQLRGETARSLLQGALVAGIEPPATFVDALYAFARETRDLTLVRFGPDTLTEGVPEPTEDDLTAYYEANEEAYTLPRRKAITYAWLTPEAMADTLDISDAVVRALYDERSDDYIQPERRLAERLVFQNEEAAQEAADRIASGEIDFDGLVAERGLQLEDVDLGVVTRADLGPAADTVFALTEPGVTDPAPTALGSALFRVNAVLAAQTTPFEEVEGDLRDEAARDAAERALQDRLEPAEDLLAGGARLEELADEMPFEIGSLTWSPGEQGEDGSPIDAYDTFRQVALETEPGDFPEIRELSDGGLFALRVDEILEPSLQPLDEVRDRVAADWMADRRRELAEQQAEAAEAEINGAAALDLSSLGGTVSRQDGLTRDAVIESAPDDLVEAAFALPEKGTAVIPTEDGAIVVRVNTVAIPGGTDPEGQAIKEGVRTAAGQGIAQDITSAFTSAIEAQKGISLNQSAVNAVLSQFN